MSFFRHKRKKIKYETLPPDSPEKKEENETVISDAFSLHAVNLFINNFVDPGDGSEKLSGDQTKCKSWDHLTAWQKRETVRNAKFLQSLNDIDARKHAIFTRIKRKMENIKNFYPDVYYSDESVIDMWAKQNELTKIHLELLEYDGDSPAWVWI